MYQPEAIYRVQLNKEFTFQHLEHIIPYLHQLGIKSIYASPVFGAVPGSLHGYDGIDPNCINPEIGTLEQWRAISRQLQDRGMGWIQDFVPNHMAYTPLNAWLGDFLEKGKMSLYDDYFDKNPDEPLMAPFLQSSLEEVIRRQEISIVFEQGKLQLCYLDTLYPLNYTAYFEVLHHPACSSIPLTEVSRLIDDLFAVTDILIFQQKWAQMLGLLNEKLTGRQELRNFRQALQQASKELSFIDRLCTLQFYRLCPSKETDSRINYRRFFTINGLISINIQKDKVFTHYHQLLHQLIRENLIQGIRIDHVDGLYDPDGYLEQLRGLVGPEVYIVVEKILGTGETLPAAWPIQGNSGYDFLAQVSNLLTDRNAEPQFSTFYHNLTGNAYGLEEQLYKAKRQILYESMQGELSNLVRTFLALPGRPLPDDTDPEDIRTVIAEVLIRCPAYRFYPVDLSSRDKALEQIRGLLEEVLQKATIPIPAFHFFKEQAATPRGESGPLHLDSRLHFWRRCMQITGPLMAKGVEDTLMYTYNKFIAHNEVGDGPVNFGMSAEDFHRLMVKRQSKFPVSINTTATHDTKRGEDARARLQYLSAIKAPWIKKAEDLLHHADLKDIPIAPADQYMILQTVYGALPLTETGDHFKNRLKDYLQKAAREAKQHSSWEHPDKDYEEALFQYAQLLSDKHTVAGKSLHNFLSEHEERFSRNALVQLTLKCTCPGVPDIYQGTELWDLSFVDPDNRRPVDYQLRIGYLNTIIQQQIDLAELWAQRGNGVVKLFTLHKLLRFRREHPLLFQKGLYQPLANSHPDECLSFLRRFGPDWLLVVVPLRGSLPSPDFTVTLPPETPLRWQHLLTAQVSNDDSLQIARDLAGFPVALYQALPPESRRRAGVLLPLFSLPSPYGIGDMGAEARKFARFLSGSGQKIWQLLPLTPVVKENGYSPYASCSAFAGDPVFIDPRQLVPLGLLKLEELQPHENGVFRKVNYEKAILLKEQLLQKAWGRFRRGKYPQLRNAFRHFCKEEAGWLKDYALYRVLKSVFKGKPWYQWDAAYSHREETAMEEISKKYEERIQEQEWQQFLFSLQWEALKTYCHQLGIRLIGDMPFYMSCDSADVWAHKALFDIDEQGKLEYTAGVPPDYFSANGQLWNMPTYNWQAMKQDSFQWWLNRLHKQASLYDLVRLDHFRAFYDYWMIPEGAKTAKEGKWEAGPRDQLFSLIKQHFPSMPFLAEDLGELHAGVPAFKDKYRLPGMRILMFGFDPYSPGLNDLPHNFTLNTVGYTGTHDNNTVVGWFQTLGKESRNNIQRYTGVTVRKNNIAPVMNALLYRSVAETAILPVQDILGLGSTARINTPATTAGNWTWRLSPGHLTDHIQRQLLDAVKRFNRLG